MSLDLSSAANQQAERPQEGWSSGWSRGAERLLNTQTKIIPGAVRTMQSELRQPFGFQQEQRKTDKKQDWN